MTLKLKDYTYARNNAPQKANGTVVLRFIGGSDSEESDIFKTNSFTVYSDGAINLSSDEYKDATVTYGSTSAPVEVRLTSPSELSLELKTYTDEGSSFFPSNALQNPGSVIPSILRMNFS